MTEKRRMVASRDRCACCGALPYGTAGRPTWLWRFPGIIEANVCGEGCARDLAEPLLFAELAEDKGVLPL